MDKETLLSALGCVGASTAEAIGIDIEKRVWKTVRVGNPFEEKESLRFHNQATIWVDTS